MKERKKRGKCQPDSELITFVKEINQIPWLYVNSLKIGDVLLVRTVNRQPGKELHRVVYKIKVLNPVESRVHVTIYRKKRKTEKVTGRILGSAMSEKSFVVVNKSGIAVGFKMIFDADDFGKLKLFPTQEVWLNHKKVLPNLSKIELVEK